MNKKILSIIVFAFLLSLGSEAYANPTISLAQKEGLPSSLTGLIGTEVKNPSGDVLGTISDFTLDPMGLPLAVIYQGDIEEFDVARYVAVPLSALSISEAKSGEKSVVLDIDRQRLFAAPRFDRGKAMNMSLPQWERIYRYFRKVPFWKEDEGRWELASR
jgi:hypothetical protein